MTSRSGPPVHGRRYGLPRGSATVRSIAVPAAIRGPRRQVAATWNSGVPAVPVTRWCNWQHTRFWSWHSWFESRPGSEENDELRIANYQAVIGRDRVRRGTRICNSELGF